MATTYEIFDFPAAAVRGQFFRVPGTAFEGGWTAGGARIMSPEPGGRAVLEVELSLQTNEWDFPLVSWLASKTNGEIFRFQLVQTPQICNLGVGHQSARFVGWEREGILVDRHWDDGSLWADDYIYAPLAATYLEGVETITVDMSALGAVLRHGHVIGYQDYSHIVDNITYDDDNLATIRIKPPLRKDLTSGEDILLRPYFLGTITNGDQLATLYEAENAGHVKPGKITFAEVVI